MVQGVPPAHELIVVPSEGEERERLRQQCYDVRIAVFIDEQGFSIDDEIDKYDETGTHILLRLTAPGDLNLKPVGTIRCVRLPDHDHRSGGDYYWKLSRLALLKECRKWGWGAELVNALHDHVRADARALASGSGHAMSQATVVCHSQIPVKRFYERFGYKPEGDEFDEDGAPHQRMVLRLDLTDPLSGTPPASSS
ncbi:acyl-CoA N-acyltransferase [Punctularia strigosozonata HHB-11173 SS5]|uniref:acyl-CoA N-acyltransferase n=1 Tax=Punctularia strigosozonata (strain HHB-11173) TaxID=741275 RepID=UPI00044163DA|nr:acyl-CoA N-acyltransferase [Punctularia strigosozonata HHB-11173 SS5]EIN10515.1 acyl-CoA N-acyltransferase [Punctularia strigosozonata HHB-11173 SS5]